ncbi:MAG: methyltransferase [Burkholderiaceae bacterium]
MTPAATTAPAASSMRDRLLATRDALLASPKFQRWAAALPFTRWIARRRAAQLFDLVGGFVYTQILLACVRLKLFDMLAAGPQTKAALAPRLGLTEEAADRLLAAAVALRLVEHRSGSRYGLGALGAPLVGNTALLAMIEHHTTLYADLADPVALLRGEVKDAALAQYFPYTRAEEPGAIEQERVAAYSTLMSASQPFVAGEILDTYDFRNHRVHLDVGGGEGTFICSVAQRAPELRMMLFDLPAVAQRARERFAQAGIAHRAQAFGGSFLTDDLPAGADLITLVRVVHDHDDARVLTLLKRVKKALAPGGALLLAEPMSGTKGAEAMGDAYFGFYLLAMGRGRTRTVAELSALLTQAGFAAPQLLPTRIPLQTKVLLVR